MKNTLGSWVLALTSAIVVFTMSCQDSSMLDEGEKVPNYTGINLEGDTVSLYDHFNQGKFLLVNFWAGWCSDCREHNPELRALYEEYQDFEINGLGFDIVSLSLDKTEMQWKSTIEKQNLHWPHHITDLNSFQSDQVKAFGIKWIPSNYLVDEDGKVIAVNVERADFEGVVRGYYD